MHNHYYHLNKLEICQEFLKKNQLSNLNSLPTLHPKKYTKNENKIKNKQKNTDFRNTCPKDFL